MYDDCYQDILKAFSREFVRVLNLLNTTRVAATKSFLSNKDVLLIQECLGVYREGEQPPPLHGDGLRFLVSENIKVDFLHNLTIENVLFPMFNCITAARNSTPYEYRKIDLLKTKTENGLIKVENIYASGLIKRPAVSEDDDSDNDDPDDDQSTDDVLTPIEEQSTADAGTPIEEQSTADNEDVLTIYPRSEFMRITRILDKKFNAYTSVASQKVSLKGSPGSGKSVTTLAHFVDLIDRRKLHNNNPTSTATATAPQSVPASTSSRPTPPMHASTKKSGTSTKDKEPHNKTLIWLGLDNKTLIVAPSNDKEYFHIFRDVDLKGTVLPYIEHIVKGSALFLDGVKTATQGECVHTQIVDAATDGKRCILTYIIMSGSCNATKGDRDYYDTQMYSWSKEDSCAAWRALKKPEDQILFEEQFFLAGGSARHLFWYNEKMIKKSLAKELAGKYDYEKLLTLNVGGESSEISNLLIGAFGKNYQTEEIIYDHMSEFVLRRLRETTRSKINEDTAYRKIKELFQNFPGPETSRGYAWENLVDEHVWFHLKTRSENVQRGSRPTTRQHQFFRLTNLPSCVFTIYKHTRHEKDGSTVLKDTSISKSDIDAGVWVSPHAFNNRAFDFIYLKGNSMTFIQCTIAPTHKIDTPYMYQFVKQYNEEVCRSNLNQMEVVLESQIKEVEARQATTTAERNENDVRSLNLRVELDIISALKKDFSTETITKLREKFSENYNPVIDEDTPSHFIEIKFIDIQMWHPPSNDNSTGKVKANILQVRGNKANSGPREGKYGPRVPLKALRDTGCDFHDLDNETIVLDVSARF